MSQGGDVTPGMPDVYPILWSSDPKRILDWAVSALGLSVVWRSPEQGEAIEHAELAFSTGRVSVNVKGDAFAGMGPSGIALACGDRDEVDAIHRSATAASARIEADPEESFVAYGFTAIDPDGNQWWVHTETGALDTLRATATPSAR